MELQHPRNLIENKLLFFSLLFSVIGVIMIYFYSKNLTPQEYNISDVKFLSEGSYIAVKGIVKEIKTNKLTTITLCSFYDPKECIEVKYFFNYYVEKGDSLLVFGIIKEWSGRTYIEVKTKDEIMKIK
jgi:DNA/RNA endonuclease YhcR with UshA esterase domain